MAGHKGTNTVVTAGKDPESCMC